MRPTEPSVSRGPWDDDPSAVDPAPPTAPPTPGAGQGSETDRRRRLAANLWLLFALQVATAVGLSLFVLRLAFGR